MQTVDRIKYADIDLYGREDASGAIREYADDLAVSNAMVNWLTSKIGDYIYDPLLGGVLDQSLFKLMTQGKTEAIHDYFYNVITQNFGGVMTIDKIVVNPDFENLTYEIEISYVSTLTNEVNLVQFSTRPPQSKGFEDFTEVPYVNTNLTNFVNMKLPLLPGVMIVKDDTTGIWTWGPYRLVNLREEDPNFMTLLRLTRGM